MKHVVAFVLLVGLLVPATRAQPTGDTARPHNVILFVSDGCGPASFTLARDFLRYKHGTEHLAIDDLLVGSIHTYATDNRVTDSAAGATAFACGVKTYNGAIAVDTTKAPVATLLEAAEAQGMATGLVATSRITHATPASFAAHVPSRSMEAEIAAQELAHGVEVLLGGGLGYFLPLDAGGWREDGRNLLTEAEKAGYQVVQDRAGFDATTQAPVLGLFANSHMDYEIDRDPAEQPSLAEMTVKAIDLLKDDPDGFFLMVEGSRIDHAGHANDAAAHLHDILAFDEAIAAARAFAETDDQTLIVSTSDHETGGLSLGRNIDGQSVYAWKPEVLDRIDASFERMGQLNQEQDATACDMLEQYAHIECTEAEAAAFARAKEEEGDPNALATEAVARRAILGWTTNGHTAVDVNLYAFGPGQEHFRGHHDNSDIGQILADLLGFDLDALTAELQQEMTGSQ
ncbi:MAG TPA: alkaline phosphatase [Rhodothermales bacterium]|nr:alkaline phosphatase [Rhodothermales bacterium]